MRDAEEQRGMFNNKFTFVVKKKKKEKKKNSNNRSVMQFFFSYHKCEIVRYKSMTFEIKRKKDLLS